MQKPDVNVIQFFKPWQSRWREVL